MLDLSLYLLFASRTPKRQKHILLTDRDRFPPPPNLNATPLESPAFSLYFSLFSPFTSTFSRPFKYLPLIFAAATIITLSNKEQLPCHNPADKPLNLKSFLANLFFFFLGLRLVVSIDHLNYCSIRKSLDSQHTFSFNSGQVDDCRADTVGIIWAQWGLWMLARGIGGLCSFFPSTHSLVFSFPVSLFSLFIFIL